MDNLPPGYGATLALMEDEADAYEEAEEKAWELLWDEAPYGVGWRIVEGMTSYDGEDIRLFFEDGPDVEYPEEAGGLTYEAVVRDPRIPSDDW